MSRNCCFGPAVNWLLLYLLLLRDLSSAKETPTEQQRKTVCTGRPALLQWNQDVKPFFGVTMTHNGSRIASLTSLSSVMISSDQFKGRLYFNSSKPFTFTLWNARQEDNGVYECIFTFDDGKTDTLNGQLIVTDFLRDDSLVKGEKKDECVNLTCTAKPPFTWTYPDGTTKGAKKINYCSKEANETIKCESEHDCKYAIYTISGCCKSNSTGRRRRSTGDKQCSCADDGTDPDTDPLSPVPILPGVLAGIIVISAIIAIIVFHKRRSRKRGVQGPPVHYISAPEEDNQDT